jgi:nitrate/TMAO reductase-like tetraheme cytochrome c subunit
MSLGLDWLRIGALLAIVAAAAIQIHHLVVRPALDLRVKLRLLFGLGVLPLIAAATSTVSGMEATTKRPFCGSCHVMQGHYRDASNPRSDSLASRHSRNPFFGERSCYVCHADYGMYGYALTKLGGMRHVYMYYLGGYHSMSLAEAERTIHIAKPYDNRNCHECHTTGLSDWRRVPDHAALAAELEANRVSCASPGCHGYAHPFTKPDTQRSPSRNQAAPAAPPSAGKNEK